MRCLLLILSISFLGPLCAFSKPSKQPEASVSQAIGVATYSYFDDVRRRPITVEFWYPASVSSRLLSQADEEVWVHPRELRNAPFAKNAYRLPLVIMSHGHGGDRRDKSWLAEKLVQNGFVVASLDHHGNTWQTMNVMATLRFWERPQDVSFAIDCLLKDPRLHGRLNPDQIGFTGYSLGGLTGLALAGGMAEELEDEIQRNKSHFPELTPEILSKVDLDPAKKSYFDQRIKAVFLMAPATWCYGKPKSLRALKTPLGIVATVSDEVLAFQEHMEPLIVQSIPVRLKLLQNGETHFVFLNRVTDKGKKILGKRIFTDPPGVDRRTIHQEIGTFAVEFFNQYLLH
jgi:predicted dienelactone hydrolase